MPGIDEITALVDRLPETDQRLLLHHLEATLAPKQPRRQLTLAEREEWMKRLDALREASRTNETGTSSDDLWEDLRADRF